MNITSNLYNHPYITMANTSTLNPYNLWYIINGSIRGRQAILGNTKTSRVSILNGELTKDKEGEFATSTPPEAFDIIGSTVRPYTWRTTLAHKADSDITDPYLHDAGRNLDLGVYTPEFPIDYFREAGSFLNICMNGVVSYETSDSISSYANPTIRACMAWCSTTTTKSGSGIWQPLGIASIPSADVTVLPAHVSYGRGIATIVFNDKVFVPKQDFEIFTHSVTVKNPCSRLVVWFSIFNHNTGAHKFSSLDLMIQVIPGASMFDVSRNGEI